MRESSRLFSTRAGASKLLIAVVIGLIAFKVAVSWLTGSISIMAQAADSLLDLFAGIITFSAIRIAARPADARHPYGHGKVEDVTGLVQAALIFIAGGLIIYSAIGRIRADTGVELAEAGIVVMTISILVSILLSRHLHSVARATGSVALEANARNIAADVYSASAVLAGLAAVRLTGLSMLDPIIAVGVAVYILKVAVETIRKPMSGLLDEKLPPLQQAAVEDSLRKHDREVSGFHALRTRRAGSRSYIDLHLVMAGDISLEQAHEICDQVEADIRVQLNDASVTVHAEPCDKECRQCSAICSKRQSG
jgi:cation diffusion facilitator family transporter